MGSSRRDEFGGGRDPASPGRFQFSTRALMGAVAVVGVEAAVVAEAAKLGPGIEFTLFIGSVLLMLNLLFPAYLATGERINRATPEQQTGQVVALGCLLTLLMLFSIPVALVILFGAQRK